MISDQGEFKTDTAVAADIKDSVETACGAPFDAVVGSLVADGAAQGANAALGYEKHICLLHEPNRIGESAIGALVRTKNKKPQNPFPEAQLIIKKAMAVAKVFRWNSRQAELYKMEAMLGLPRRRPTLPNKTRYVRTAFNSHPCFLSEQRRRGQNH